MKTQHNEVGSRLPGQFALALALASLALPLALAEIRVAFRIRAALSPMARSGPEFSRPSPRSEFWKSSGSLWF